MPNDSIIRKKMDFKKLTSFFLTVMLILSIVSVFGCGKKVKYNPNNFLPNGTIENPNQIVKEPITLKVFVPKSSMNPAYNSMVSFQELSRITNIKFNFIEASIDAYSSLRTVTWENKDELPDFFLFCNSLAEQMIYSQYGALVPWNKDDLNVSGVKVGNLINSYMPNYKALLDSNFHNPDYPVKAVDTATLDDGFMYSLVCCSDVPRDRTFKMYINETWIKNLNEDYGLNLPLSPSTVEEYLTVLRAFRDYDANRNGDSSDEIPVTSSSLHLLRNFLLAPYGYISPGIEIEDDRSKFTYVPSTNAYRQYLRLAYTLYKEKLLDNSTFEMISGSQLAGKGYDNRLGCWADAAAYLTVGKDLENNYTSFGPLKSSETIPLKQYAIKVLFLPEGAVITSGSPYVREIARLLDYMYSPAGTALMSVGREGHEWTWDDNQKTQWTFNIPKDFKGTQEEFRAKISPSVGTGCALYTGDELSTKQNNPTLTKVNKEVERYIPYLKRDIPEDFKMTAGEYERVAAITASLDVYIQMMEANFIKGKKMNIDNDADWNEFLKGIKDYGCEELAHIYNTALARQKK